MAKQSKSPAPRYRHSIVGYIPTVFSAEKKSLLKSKTVPNDALTVQQIVIKYANGLYPQELERQGTFDPNAIHDSHHDTPDLEKLAAMDIHDRELHLDAVRQEVAVAKAKLALINEAEQKRRQSEQLEDAENKLLLRKLKRTGKETPRKDANAGGGNGGSEADDGSND